MYSLFTKWLSKWWKSSNQAKSNAQFKLSSLPPRPIIPSPAHSIQSPTLGQLAWEQTRIRILLGVSIIVDGLFFVLWYRLTLLLDHYVDITQLASVLDQQSLKDFQYWSAIGTLGFVILMVSQDLVLFFVEVLISIVQALKRLWQHIIP